MAVLGSGVDVIYPKENSRLSEQILSFGGALVSEFPLGTFAAPQNFPIRNRILSGMSAGVTDPRPGWHAAHPFWRMRVVAATSTSGAPSRRVASRISAAVGGSAVGAAAVGFDQSNK